MNGPGEHGRGGLDLRTAIVGSNPLLPTPAVNDMGEGKTPEVWDEWTDKMKARHSNGNGHGNSLAIEAQRTMHMEKYEPAICLWESITRPAPEPVEPTGRNGAHRLSARFAEWMMGLPNGWITDTPGITRREALKACGNGVVPQQAKAALKHLLMVRERFDDTTRGASAPIANDQR